MAELQWFITEQVEEEKTVREIVAKLKMVSNDPASLLDLDRELGGPEEPDAGAGGVGELLSLPGQPRQLLASSVVAKRSNTPSSPAMASSSVMPVRRADQTQTAASAAHRHVRRDDLAQPRAVDVVHARELEQHVPGAAADAVVTASFSMPGWSFTVSRPVSSRHRDPPLPLSRSPLPAHIIDGARGS